MERPDRETVRFSLRAKILIGFFSVIILLLLSSVVSSWRTLRNSAMIENINASVLPETLAFAEIQADTLRIQQLMSYSAATSDPVGSEKAEEYYQKAQKSLNTLIKEHQGEEAAALRARLESLRTELEDFMSLGQQMVQAYHGSGADIGNTMMERFNPAAASITESMAALVDEGNGIMRDDFGALLSSFWSSLFLSIGAVIICAALSFVVAMGLSGSISKTIRHTVDMLKNISEGEGDLTRQLEVASNDEIGAMSTYFNKFTAKFRKLIATIKRQSENLSAIGLELSSHMSETAASINLITANIQSIKNQTVNQAASVTETNTTMIQITQNIQRLDSHIERQVASVTQSSSSVEEILANIGSVTSTLEKNARNVHELTAASESGRADLSAISQNIREVAKESEGLLEISAVIQNIAAQTNLLSMNAAIESAHAGASGSGFAVVADEIRKLAESSGAQSKIVSVSLKNIKSSIERITKATDTVLKKFEDIDEKIKTISEQDQVIMDAMTEQKEGSKEILVAIEQLNEITTMVKSGSDEMMTGSQEVIQESKKLGKITDELTDRMSTMATGAEQINIAVNSVNDISQNTKDSIDALMIEVGKFKIE